jgi:hypothetical protein
VPLRHAHQHLAGRGVQLIAVTAHDQDDRDRIYREPAEGEGQGFHRPAVGPLHIVDDQRHRAGSLLITDHCQHLGPDRERRRPRRLAGE